MWLMRGRWNSPAKPTALRRASLRTMDGGPSKTITQAVKLKFDEKGRRVGAGVVIVQWQSGVPVTVFSARSRTGGAVLAEEILTQNAFANFQGVIVMNKITRRTLLAGASIGLMSPRVWAQAPSEVKVGLLATAERLMPPCAIDVTTHSAPSRITAPGVHRGPRSAQQSNLHFGRCLRHTRGGHQSDRCAGKQRASRDLVHDNYSLKISETRLSQDFFGQNGAASARSGGKYGDGHAGLPLHDHGRRRRRGGPFVEFQLTAWVMFRRAAIHRPEGCATAKAVGLPDCSSAASSATYRRRSR